MKLFKKWSSVILLILLIQCNESPTTPQTIENPLLGTKWYGGTDCTLNFYSDTLCEYICPHIYLMCPDSIKKEKTRYITDTTRYFLSNNELTARNITVPITIKKDTLYLGDKKYVRIN